jgi:hypothetical protein
LVYRKYAHGNAAYKAKTGLDLFTGLKSLEKRQKEALTDEQDEREFPRRPSKSMHINPIVFPLVWAGTISIGTPAQSFLIDFDT